MPSHKWRGKALKELPGRGKGICPICSRKSVKVIWDSTDSNGKAIKVCKWCRNWKKRSNYRA